MKLTILPAGVGFAIANPSVVRRLGESKIYFGFSLASSHGRTRFAASIPAEKQKLKKNPVEIRLNFW